MELRHLRYFMAVAEEQSVTRAAARLNIAQPALSHQIKALETEIGAALFVRFSRGVALTEPGRFFAEDARAILASVEAAKTKARRTAVGQLGLVRIGFTGSASFHPFVTGVIRDFRAAFPDVTVELIEEPTRGLLDGLASRRVDVAFMRPAAGEVEQLWSRHLFDEPMVAAVPVGHHLAEARSLRLSALAAETFIIYPRQNGRTLYDIIVSACEAAGFAPRIGQAAPQLTSVVNLVATGIALAIVPRSMSRMATADVRFVAIEDESLVAPMVLVREEAPRTTPAKNFTELCMTRLSETLRADIGRG